MEKWMDVEGFEGLYQISSFGNVRRNGKMANRKLVKTRKGYFAIDLWKNGIMQTFRVHRLVAKSFIPNPNNKETVNHKDGNKENNCINNLEWCTNLENVRHAISNGLYDNKIKCGSKNINSKLNEKSAREIYDLAVNKVFSVRELCEMYNVSKFPILQIKNKKAWIHIHKQKGYLT